MTQACVLGVLGTAGYKHYTFSESMVLLDTYISSEPFVKIEVLPFKYNNLYKNIYLVQFRGGL